MMAEDIFEKLNSAEKTKLGKMAKKIFDLARIMFLIENKKIAFLEKYCCSTISPENFVIIVKNM